jgi:hypothetical protein
MFFLTWALAVSSLLFRSSIESEVSFAGSKPLRKFITSRRSTSGLLNVETDRRLNLGSNSLATFPLTYYKNPSLLPIEEIDVLEELEKGKDDGFIYLQKSEERIAEMIKNLGDSHDEESSAKEEEIMNYVQSYIRLENATIVERELYTFNSEKVEGKEPVRCRVMHL